MVKRGYGGLQGGHKGIKKVTGSNFSVLLETVRLMKFLSQLWYTRW